MDIRVQTVILYLKEDLARGISVSEIAGMVNLSSPRLRHLFKAETGVTIAKYQKSLRMQAAKELLENSFLRVKEIMNKIGMHDESHFSRDFKRTYGLAPAKYRTYFHSSSIERFKVAREAIK